MATVRESIDFRSERGRHETLLGREDVLAELARLLGHGGDSRGWVLVKGGPGMGKSALLAHYLQRMEDKGQRVPHHFLRRGVEDWDRPEMVARNLAAQVEALFPEQARGNILYTLKLLDWLEEQPPERRRAELLPQGLEAFLVEVWQRLLALPAHERTVALIGLGTPEDVCERSMEAAPSTALPPQGMSSARGSTSAISGYWRPIPRSPVPNSSLRKPPWTSASSSRSRKSSACSRNSCPRSFAPSAMRRRASTTTPSNSPTHPIAVSSRSSAR